MSTDVARAAAEHASSCVRRTTELGWMVAMKLYWRRGLASWALEVKRQQACCPLISPAAAAVVVYVEIEIEIVVVAVAVVSAQ